MSNIIVGSVVQGDHGVREVPAGTKLVRVGTTDIKTRAVHGGRWFEEGGSGWDGEWVVVGLAPEPVVVPKPDLTDKGVLALELYRVRTDDPKRAELPGYSADLWLKAAQLVLDNFEPKTARTANIGDKVKVTNDGDGDHWVPSSLVGRTGTVRETIDSDNELYISFGDRTDYVHVSALELV